MIQKYTYGTPFETDAIVTSIPASEGAPAYGTISTENGFSFTYDMDDNRNKGRNTLLLHRDAVQTVCRRHRTAPVGDDDSAVFPGIQGGPLEHVIAAKAVAFGECLQPEYKEYQKQVQKNAAVLAQALIDRGFTIVSGGTDNHSMLVDLRSKYPTLTGKVAEKALVSADITVNKNMVPFDSRSAFQTSGIRLGTPAITTRGAKEDLMLEIAEMIETVLSNVENEEVIAQVRARVNKTMEKYPIFGY